MKLFDLLAHVVTGYRWATGLLVAGLSVLAVAGLWYVPGPASQERAEAPSASRLRTASEEFDRRPADCFLVVEVDDLFTSEAVTALREVVASVEQLPYVESVVWVDTVPVLNVFGLRQPLLPPNASSVERFEDARRRVLAHPLITGQLLSADGKTLLMPVRFDWLQVASDDDCTSGLLERARNTAAGFSHVPMRIRLTGRVPLYLAYQQSFDRNQRKFQIIAYTLVLLLAVILFRGLQAVFVVAAAPGLGTLWSLGLLNWMGEMSNPLTSVVLPVLLTMVGLTDGVHLMMHIRQVRAAGAPPVEAARSALRQVGLACFLTSLTTAIGFGSLLLAHSEFVRGFGRACAIGVSVTFFSVVLVVPWLSSTWLGNRIHRGHERDLVGHGLQRFGWLVELVVRHARWVSLVAVICTLALAVVAAQLRPDDKTRDSQPTRSEPYEALAHCDNALGGIETVRILVEWPEGVAADSPAILAAIQDVERLLHQEGTLRHPLSILSILASLPGDQPVTERMPFLQLLPNSVRQTYLNPETRQAVVTARLQDLGIARYEPVFRQVEEKLQALGSKYPEFVFRLTGDPVTRGRNLYRIVVDLASSLGTATIIIFIVMGVAYRSWRIGMISVIPNLFPLVVTAAMMVWLGHPLEIAGVCAFTVCLGIAVDDTIHYLTRYREELDAGAGVNLALRRAFEKVGAAMLVTTAILITGFGTVLTSELPGQRYFATMAVSTITAALVGDLIFLPALLAAFDRPHPASPSRRGVASEPYEAVSNS